MKLFIYILPILIFYGCVPDTSKTQDNEVASITKKIDSIGQAYIDGGEVKGISIAVLKKNDTLYNKGFGFLDAENKKPVTNQDIFLMASVSKLVGATMIMKLVEEERLSLDQTLFELLPDFPNPSQAKTIKLHQLISHTSGLTDYATEIDSMYLQTRASPTKEDFYNFFTSYDLLFEPGTKYCYTNSGFLLMGMIIERITGNPFDSELDRIINQPTGLNLKLIAERIENPNLSPYYERQDSIFIEKPHWPWIKGDGGLTTTSLDLVHFPLKWADGTIINRESFEEMSTPTRLADGVQTGYGLGVRTGEFEGMQVIGHTGGNKSGYAMMMFFPAMETSIVVFVNTDNTRSDAISIMGYVALAVMQKDVPILADTEILDEDLTRFIGEYDFYEYGGSILSITTYVSKEDGHLYRKETASSSNGEKLYYMGDDAFAPERYPMDRVVFARDSTGAISAAKNYWNGFFQRMGFKVK